MTGSSDGIYAAYLSGRSGSGFAIYATWRAPIAAAQLAEQLRRAADRDQERQRHKLHLFATLMQERAALYTENGVRARNLIDVVFSDAREVRDAWAEFFHSLDPVQKVPLHAQMEKLRAILATMARNIGLADDLRVEDLTRVYLPAVLAQAIHHPHCMGPATPPDIAP